MEKKNKKISNQQIISIVCLAVIIICVINAFFWNMQALSM